VSGEVELEKAMERLISMTRHMIHLFKEVEARKKRVMDVAKTELGLEIEPQLRNDCIIWKNKVPLDYDIAIEFFPEEEIDIRGFVPVFVIEIEETKLEDQRWELITGYREWILVKVVKGVELRMAFRLEREDC